MTVESLVRCNRCDKTEAAELTRDDLQGWLLILESSDFDLEGGMNSCREMHLCPECVEDYRRVINAPRQRSMEV
jgi:hypothetical protein